MADMKERSDITRWVRQELAENAEEKYKAFQKLLVPGLENMLGVRVPKIREIAKYAAKNGYRIFADEADLSIYEEVMVRGMMIGYANLSMQEQKRELESFIPHISNWAICDSCCSTYKFMKKNQEFWFPFLASYAKSSQEYEIRFAVVCMLDFFINETYIDSVLRVLESVSHEGYYVKMAVAWAISSCYIKFPEKTERILDREVLDMFTHNKAIQKIRESFKVSKEEKERLNLKKRR